MMTEVSSSQIHIDTEGSEEENEYGLTANQSQVSTKITVPKEGGGLQKILRNITDNHGIFEPHNRKSRKHRSLNTVRNSSKKGHNLSLYKKDSKSPARNLDLRTAKHRLPTTNFSQKVEEMAHHYGSGRKLIEEDEKRKSQQQFQDSLFKEPVKYSLEVDNKDVKH